MKTIPDVFESTGEIEVCRNCGGKVEVISAGKNYEIYMCPNPECGTENQPYEYKVMIEEEFDVEEEEEEFDNIPSKKSKDYWG